MTDLSNGGPIDRWGSSAHPERRCTAHRKTGDRCKNAARLGTTVCDFHGAKAPQVKAKARQRLEEAADRMACELLKMATDENVADSVKLAAVRDALDRAGLGAKTAVEVEVGPPKPWEQIMSGLTKIESGSRAEFRRSRVTTSDNEERPTLLAGSSELALPIEVEVVEGSMLAAPMAANPRTIRRRST